MKNSRAAGIAAAGLAVGLTLGSIGIATAATTAAKATTSTATTATAPVGQPSDHGGPAGAHGRGGMGDIAEAVANLTGLAQSEVETQRHAGTSYEAVAKTKGVSADEVLAETVKIEKAELAAEVKAGTLTQAEADKIISGMESELKTAISSTDALRGPGGHGDRHGRGDGDGDRGGRDATSGASSTTTTPAQ